MPITIDGSGSMSGGSASVLETLQASTSGTAVSFNAVPSWVRRITISLAGVSTSGTSVVIVQLGSTSYATSGYLCGAAGNSSGVANANYTTGFGIEAGASIAVAAAVRHGVITIASLGGNTWAASGVVGYSNAASSSFFGGSIALAGVLDRVRLTTVNGTDTFDAGSVNLLYE
jgi:hypothetical protein